MSTRKAIAAALLKQLTAGGQFAKSGRRLRAPEQAALPGKPALYLIKLKEEFTFEGDATTPPTRELLFDVVIYSSVGDDQAAVPADVEDDLLDVIDAALAPSVADQLQNGGRQTLSGLVYNCRIDGTIDFAPGDKDGKGELWISIRITLKDYP